MPKYYGENIQKLNDAPHFATCRRVWLGRKASTTLRWRKMSNQKLKKWLFYGLKCKLGQKCGEIIQKLAEARAGRT